MVLEHGDGIVHECLYMVVEMHQGVPLRPLPFKVLRFSNASFFSAVILLAFFEALIPAQGLTFRQV